MKNESDFSLRPDFGTSDLARQLGRELEPSDFAGHCVARVIEEHLLDRLVLVGYLAPLDRDIAMRFHADYRAAGLMQRMGGSYAPVRGDFSYYNGWDERSDAEEEAYTRWRGAMRFLKGDLADIVVSIICYEEQPDAYRLRGLKAGLKILRAFYIGRTQ